MAESVDSSQSLSLSSRRSSRSSLNKPLVGQSSTPVLSAEYLNRHSSKNDLVKRLVRVIEDLKDDDVEPNSPDYPGLASLAAVLVENRYLKHKDKEVRLHSILACMEMFAKYAPEPPWDEAEILNIFPQLIQQLANLSNCTSPTHPYFEQYYALLEHLALVKTGIVLIEATKTLDHEIGALSDDEDDDFDDYANAKSLRNSTVNGNGPTSEEALGILCELIETLLNSISIDHPPEVSHLVEQMVVGCIAEFDVIPIPVLDEILKCIGNGPVIQVTNPDFVKASAAIVNAKKKKRKKGEKLKLPKLPPMHVEQTNQSYVIAKRVITKTLDRISTPIANLLNGLLNGDNNVVKHSDISSDVPALAPREKSEMTLTVTDCIPEPETNILDVWTIVFELHKVSPDILTTVIGTVANSLTHHTEEKRLRVTHLLGRLFCSRSSDIAVNFHPCYRKWAMRAFDHSLKIRQVMVDYLIAMLKEKPFATNICQEATNALVQMIIKDDSLVLRSLCIHRICEFVYHYGGEEEEVLRANNTLAPAPYISADLIRAVGDRVKSKTKKERLEAITGLAKIYNKHYIWNKIGNVQKGGEDCSIETVVETIRENCDFSIFHPESKSPHSGKKKKKHKQSKSPSPKNSRVGVLHSPNRTDDRYKFIPKLVFECSCIKDSVDPSLRTRIMTIIDDALLGNISVKSKNTDTKTNQMSPTSRAISLTMIINYLQSLTDEDGDSKYAFLRALMMSRKKLQMALRSYTDARAKVESFPNGSIERTEANAAAFQKLEVVAALVPPPSATTPPGTSSDDLSTVLNKLHNGAKDKHIFRLLASISSPSHSMNARSRALNDLPKRTQSLGPSASSWIRSLAKRCAMGHFFNAEIISHCIQLAQESFNEGEFQVCRSFLDSSMSALSVFPNMVTKEMNDMLVEFFGECRESHHREDRKQIDELDIVTRLSTILACISSNNTSPSNGSKTSSSASDESLSDEKMQAELISLCTKDGTPEQSRNAVLTLAGRLKSDPSKQTAAFTSLLKTLTSPSRLTLTTNGSSNKKIVNVLTTLTAMAECVPSIFIKTKGQNDRGAKAIRFAYETILLGRGGEDDVEYRSDSSDSRENNGHKNGGKPRRNSGGRSPKMSPKGKHSKDQTQSLSCKRICGAIAFLVAHIRGVLLLSKVKDEAKMGVSPEHISNIFNTLVNLIQNGGEPLSSRDERECITPWDKSEIRKCASVHFLRLCDGNLQLERTCVSPKMWHILSQGCLDEVESVRDTVMRELSSMLRGENIYRCRALPHLRFLALVTLCPDSDSQNYIANGGAANVGRQSNAAKESSLQCISKLRRTCDATQLRLRAISRQAELNFERKLKHMMMPEFVVPYAFHLLAFRAETPSIGFDTAEDGWSDADEDARHKMLNKRLKWLYDPLVQSLGDGADNISFLLRQCELLGNRYRPVNVIRGDMSESSETKDILQARLRAITLAAREVLMKYIKKDVNLTPYPGTIQIPSSLFEVVAKMRKKSRKRSPVENSGDSGLDDKVDLEISVVSNEWDPTSIRSPDESDGALDINLSPIPMSKSPESTSSSPSGQSQAQKDTSPTSSTHHEKKRSKESFSSTEKSFECVLGKKKGRDTEGLKEVITGTDDEGMSPTVNEVLKKSRPKSRINGRISASSSRKSASKTKKAPIKMGKSSKTSKSKLKTPTSTGTRRSTRLSMSSVESSLPSRSNGRMSTSSSRKSASRAKKAPIKMGKSSKKSKSKLTTPTSTGTRRSARLSMSSDESSLL